MEASNPSALVLWLKYDIIAKQLNLIQGWRNSDGDIKRVLTIAYFDKLGVPRLS